MRGLFFALALPAVVLTCAALSAVRDEPYAVEHAGVARTVVELEETDTERSASIAVADQVIVNNVVLEPKLAAQLAAGIGVRAQAGRYWYDARSGAFGLEGQGALGVLRAGLALGGSLRPDASGGGDGRYGGVFVNGRELHPTDIAGLQQMLGQVTPGRYWVDAYGNFGYEHGPTLGNLLALAQMRGGAARNGPRGTRPSSCYGDTSCDTSHTWVGENYFSDGKTGCIVMDGEISC